MIPEARPSFGPPHRIVFVVDGFSHEEDGATLQFFDAQQGNPACEQPSGLEGEAQASASQARSQGVADALAFLGVPGFQLSLAGLSVPAFYLGILLILLFAVQLRWLPAIGGGGSDDLPGLVAALALPALTLGLVMAASVARLTRGAMLSGLAQDYVRTARVKGLREHAVVLTHTLRPALVPVVSLIGVWTLALIGDSVTTEVVFSRPGLGKMLVGALLQRDYTSLQSVMVIYTLFVVAINLATDLAYACVDPRIGR